MKKTTWAVLGTSVLAMVAIPLTTAFAANNDSFTQQYQAKSQQEASLLQQVQSSSVTSPTIQALESTVTNINTQTTNLYNALQALNSGVSSIPQVDPTQFGELKDLQGRRQEIVNANNKAWNNVEFDVKHHQKAALKHDMQQHTYWSNQLKDVNAKLKTLEDKYGIGLAPYSGARSSLEDSILHLEDSVIRYTNEIIQLQAQSSTSTTGSVYGTDGSSNSTTD